MGRREAYYDQRAAEYDETITAGLDAETIAAWEKELIALGRVLADMPSERVVDVACGTGLFTRFLRGQVVAVDQSAGMLKAARARVPAAHLVRASAMALPFGRMVFDRVVACHFYGHLTADERTPFLMEARRVAPELVVVDTAASLAGPTDGWEMRVLRDGTEHSVFKRRFTAAQLVAELRGDGGDGEALFDARFFVAVRSISN